MEPDVQQQIDECGRRAASSRERASKSLTGDVARVVEAFFGQPSRERGDAAVRAIYSGVLVETLPESDMMSLARLALDIQTFGYVATAAHQLATLEPYEESVDLSEPLCLHYHTIEGTLQQQADSVVACLGCSLRDLFESEHGTLDSATVEAVGRLGSLALRDRVYLIPQLLQARWALATGWLRDHARELEHHR